MKKKSESLKICEMFYSIQGEGFSVGYPAVFIRLSGCNLSCNGFSYKDKKGIHLGCDSKMLWTKSISLSFEEIFDKWENNNWLTYLKNNAHLIITGGEPLLQQEEILEFLKCFKKKYSFLPKIEIETNATLIFKTRLLKMLYQINASPKLSFTLDPEKNRYHPNVIQQITNNKKAYFKFVLHFEEEFFLRTAHNVQNPQRVLCL